jgi:RNA-directed DNA polymerase
MMHGPEKSDPVIVAGKPANKAEQPPAERSAGEPNAAERVEPRVGTKGNAGQQSRCRTQSRASLSQELGRIRQVARERKKERFTALFHHISIELLAEAFFELKKDAAAGVDRLRWRDYEADLERNIEDLQHRVQRGAGYDPAPVTHHNAPFATYKATSPCPHQPSPTLRVDAIGWSPPFLAA